MAKMKVDGVEENVKVSIRCRPLLEIENDDVCVEVSGLCGELNSHASHRLIEPVKLKLTMVQTVAIWLNGQLVVGNYSGRVSHYNDTIIMVAMCN